MSSAKRKTRNSATPRQPRKLAEPDTPDPPADEPPRFEATLARLREAVERLESPEIDLEEAFEALEAGARSYRECRRILELAREKVEVLVGEFPDGKLRWTTLEEAGEDLAELPGSDEDGS